MPEWKKLSENEVLNGDGFYISYNPRPGMGLSMFMGDNGSDETALVIDNKKGKCKYLILNGDYRKDYEQLFLLGLKFCLEFYEKHKNEAQSSWSEDRLDEIKN